MPVDYAMMFEKKMLEMIAKRSGGLDAGNIGDNIDSDTIGDTIPYDNADIDSDNIGDNIDDSGAHAVEELSDTALISTVALTLGGEAKDCYERKKDAIEAIKIALIRDYLPTKNDVLLLGTMAVDWYLSGNKICPKFDRVQVAGKIGIDELVQDIKTYITDVLRLKCEIQVSDSLDLLIPKDFRTRRTILSITIQSAKEKPFLEYFNSCEFEILPVIRKHDVLLANPHVLARFLFIDLWITEFIYALKKIDDNSYKKRKTRLSSCLAEVAKMPFRVDGFMGIYYEYDISKKEKKIGQETIYYPYNPHDYLAKHGNLRSLR
jgi:hypothetical protein